MDTVQRVLEFLLPLVGPEGAVQCFHVCKSWREELEAGGFCSKTSHLCSALAEGGDAARLGQNALRSLDASSGDDAERALCLDGGAFLEKWLGRKGSLQEWLQAASQEPDASFLSRGAASTAQSLGLALVEWVDKPQGRYPESYALPGHSKVVCIVALSRDGTRAASASEDKFVKIWHAETGAEVSSLE
jgi:WD40 repeat protein